MAQGVISLQALQQAEKDKTVEMLLLNSVDPYHQWVVYLSPEAYKHRYGTYFVPQTEYIDGMIINVRAYGMPMA